MEISWASGGYSQINESTYRLSDFLEETLGHDDRVVATIETFGGSSSARLKFNTIYELTVTLAYSYIGDSKEKKDIIGIVIDLWDKFFIDAPDINNRYKILFYGDRKEASEFLLKYSLQFD